MLTPGSGFSPTLLSAAGRMRTVFVAHIPLWDAIPPTGIFVEPRACAGALAGACWSQGKEDAWAKPKQTGEQGESRQWERGLGALGMRARRAGAKCHRGQSALCWSRSDMWEWSPWATAGLLCVCIIHFSCGCRG